MQIECACEGDIPGDTQFLMWASAAFKAGGGTPNVNEITLRIVDETESGALNHQFRGVTGATNVLSFPCDAETPEPIPFLGDIVICAPVISREASQQNKSTEAHWAHIMVHGVLHLLGHDHVVETDAEQMEYLETEILNGLDYLPPYEACVPLQQT